MSEQRDRRKLARDLNDILNETLGNLEGVEEELARVKRRLLQHLQPTRDADF
jgi:hypothetical protein